MKKYQGTLALLLSAAVALTACGKVPTRTNQQGGGPSAATVGLTTLRVAVIGMDPLLDAQISAYYDKYPDVRIEKVAITPAPGYIDQLKDKVRQGQVDIIPAGLVEDMVKENLVVDLGPFITKTKFDTKPYGTLGEQMKWDGKVYDLTINIYPQVMLYNIDLFTAAGLKPPAEGWTWDQFRETAKMLTKGSGDAKVYGFSGQLPENLIDVALEQRSPTGYGPQAAAKDIREVLQFGATLALSDQVIPKPEERDWGQSGSFNPDQNRFQSGRAAMSQESLSFLTFLGSSLKFKWDVAPVPTWPGGKNTAPVGFRTYGLAASGKQMDAAWKFLSFMCGPEGAVVTAKAGSLPAYRTPEVKKAWFDRQPSPPPGTETLFSTDWTTQPRTEDKGIGALDRPYRSAINAVLIGKKSPEDATKDMLAEIEQIKKNPANK